MIDYAKNRRIVQSAPRRLIGIDAGGVFRFESWSAFTLAEMAKTRFGKTTLQKAYDNLCARITPGGKILNCPEALTALGIVVRPDMHGTIPTEAPVAA